MMPKNHKTDKSLGLVLPDNFLVNCVDDGFADLDDYDGDNNYDDDYAMSKVGGANDDSELFPRLNGVDNDNNDDNGANDDDVTDALSHVDNDNDDDHDDDDNDDDDDDDDALPQVDGANDDSPAEGALGLLTAPGGQDPRAASGCQEVTNTYQH